MKNKYYTPEIEEFHIGFEYEWLDEEGNWNKEDSPKEITKEGFDEQAYGLRVKYLDREDIESLGFKCIIKDQYIDGENCILIDSDYFVQIINKGDDYSFQGIIKNISELKVILSQIGVKFATK